MLAQKTCDLRPDLIMAMEYFHSVIEDFIFLRKQGLQGHTYSLYIFYSLDLSHSVLSSLNQANCNRFQSNCT